MTVVMTVLSFVVVRQELDEELLASHGASLY
jgi:hypothetical protein